MRNFCIRPGELHLAMVYDVFDINLYLSGSIAGFIEAVNAINHKKPVATPKPQLSTLGDYVCFNYFGLKAEKHSS
jgi:hypothetical protein